MPGRNIVVIGGSAGAVPALVEICRGLPANIPAAVFVVVHSSPQSPGVLPRLLDKVCALPVLPAAHRQAIENGRMIIAPADHHLLLEPERVVLTRGPKMNGFRPAIDPLFSTAAAAFGARVVGIVLSGGLDDGTAGLKAIKAAGGAAIVQDPLDAIVPSMPSSAIAAVEIDYILPVREIPAMLAQLAREPIGASSRPMARRERKKMSELLTDGDRSLQNGDLAGPPSGFTCPDCGGALWELSNGKLVQYRCHVGHGYSPETFAQAQDTRLESALWSALRILEENIASLRRMAEHASRFNLGGLRRQYLKRAGEAELRARTIRKVLTAEPEKAAPAKRHLKSAGNRKKSAHFRRASG